MHTTALARVAMMVSAIPVFGFSGPLSGLSGRALTLFLLCTDPFKFCGLLSLPSLNLAALLSDFLLGCSVNDTFSQ